MKNIIYNINKLSDNEILEKYNSQIVLFDSKEILPLMELLITDSKDRLDDIVFKIDEVLSILIESQQRKSYESNNDTVLKVGYNVNKIPKENEQNIIKTCPFCKLPISMEEGCFKVRCSSNYCKNQMNIFCYNCSEKLNEETQASHFPSGYYSECINRHKVA